MLVELWAGRWWLWCRGELERARRADGIGGVLLPKNLKNELHGDEENIDGWIKSFVCIYLYLRRKECVDCQEAHLALA